MNEVFVKCLSFFLLILGTPQGDLQPLPDSKVFIEAFRRTSHDDPVFGLVRNTPTKLRREYTYTVKETSLSLDSKGNVKNTKTSEHRVTPSSEPLQTYVLPISRNNIPLTDEELARYDRQEQDRIAKENLKQATEPEKHRQQQTAADAERKEFLDDVFAMYDFQLVRREMVEGIRTILVTFKAKPDYKPKTGDGKFLKHIGGKAWIAEDDHELVREEAEVIDSISIAGGLIAKIYKGSRSIFERMRFNGEIWLPVREETSINARIALLKGLYTREIIEYLDYKKYTVEAVLKSGGDAVQSQQKEW
jgi:hypothetical protein